MTDKKPLPRSKLARRRVINIAVTIVICSVLLFALLELNRNLLHASYASGYVLLGCLFFLTAFNIRKKLAFLPQIGTAATWMQLHIYVGLSTFVLFGTHVSWRIPDGQLEGFLAVLYVLVAFSGVYGLFITRLIPKRLTAIGDEVVYERIPSLRAELALQARQTAMGTLMSTHVIPQFYARHLFPFFERGRGFGYLLLPTGRKRRRLLGQIEGLNRYLTDEQRHVSKQLKGFVQQKDDLDYHCAMQGRLKAWLFIHIGFTYSLLAVAVLHGILVHAFAGGLM